MMKGTIKDDHIPVNKFELRVLGLPPIVFTTVSGLGEELNVVDLPDRSVASGGHTGPVEFTARHPMHHEVEEAALEAWFQACQDPVSPLYRKPGHLKVASNTGNISKIYPLIQLFPSQRTLPDFEMENEGDMAESEWTFRATDMLPPV